jgi:hypothetical protein
MSSPANRTACVEEEKRLGSPSSARIVTDVSAQAEFEVSGHVLGH